MHHRAISRPISLRWRRGWRDAPIRITPPDSGGLSAASAHRQSSLGSGNGSEASNLDTPQLHWH
ncbi:hypothetical protein [Achromobacter sp. RTa]|uniref:hypothetical protein n=1 Tax=Achromobacter sp. RTa TaxID=1532557 RepID=UPI0012E05859|nr:hypothetical protein [Achromobacter sp. RTa]